MLRRCRGLASALELSSLEFTPDDIELDEASQHGCIVSGIMRNWPKILISSGQPTVDTAVAIRNYSQMTVFSVHIQWPHTYDGFDFLIVPRHDNIPEAPDIFLSEGALHDVTPELLNRSKQQFRSFLELRSPRVIVLIGATNHTFFLGEEQASAIADQLIALKEKYQAQLLVSTSRRTGVTVKQVLKDRLSGRYELFWDGEAPSPYLGMLSCADYVFVTPDSIAMICEAAVTKKPIYYFQLPEIGHRCKPFLNNMQELGILRPFTGVLDQWRYAPLTDLERAASAAAQAIARKSMHQAEK